MTFKTIRNALIALLSLTTFSTAIAGYPVIPEPTVNEPYGSFEVAATFSNVDNILQPSTIYGVSGTLGAAWPLSSTRWFGGAVIGYTFVGNQKFLFTTGGAGILIKFHNYAYNFALQLIYAMSDRLSFTARVGAGIVHHPVDFSIVSGTTTVTLPVSGTDTVMYAGFNIDYRLFSRIYVFVGYDYYNSDDALNVIKTGLAVHFS